MSSLMHDSDFQRLDRIHHQIKSTSKASHRTLMHDSDFQRLDHLHAKVRPTPISSLPSQSGGKKKGSTSTPFQSSTSNFDSSSSNIPSTDPVDNFLSKFKLLKKKPIQPDSDRGFAPANFSPKESVVVADMFDMGISSDSESSASFGLEGGKKGKF